MPTLPIATAAEQLGVTPRQLRRWLAAGAPVAARGGRGRGRATLVDPSAIAAWRAGSAAQACGVAVLELAAEIPELAADAIHVAFSAIDGPHKRACGPALAAAWYALTVAVLDRLRELDAAVPHVTALPERIDRLRKMDR